LPGFPLFYQVDNEIYFEIMEIVATLIAGGNNRIDRKLAPTMIIAMESMEVMKRNIKKIILLVAYKISLQLWNSPLEGQWILMTL
jgi:predicted transcriptional regulator